MASCLKRGIHKTALNLRFARLLGRVSQLHSLQHDKRLYYNQKKPKDPELFPQRLILPEDHGYVPTLSPPQVSSLFAINETGRHAKKAGTHSILGFDSNQLPSNHPVEDRRSQAHLLQTDGKLFGVYDGHGGCACAQALTERLFEYIAVSLLPPEKLEQFNHAMRTDSPMELLLHHRHHEDYYNAGLSDIYRSSLHKYVVEALSTFDDTSNHVADAMVAAFDRLDMDLCTEALPFGGGMNFDAAEVVMSGACATVVHIDELEVTIANSGDCKAVLGQFDDTSGQFIAKPLTVEHNYLNTTEVERLKASHPKSESNFLIKNNRLLGQLIPLRAFGDARYKWTAQDLRNVVNILDTPFAHSIVPANYYTPPYLTVTPDITQHTLGTQDKFLILSTDGLWDLLSDDQAVQLVGKHLEGKQTAQHFRLTEKNMKLGAINDILVKRKSGLAQKSVDDNVATHLIRHALGYEHRKVSEMLTLPPDVCRYYRDDMTVTVIYFDSEYIAKQDK